MPNKYILKSDSSFMVIGKSPAWYPTGYGFYESGKVFSLTQSVSYDFSSTRQAYKQLGYQNYSSNIEYKAPEINLSIDYYFSPYLNNELLMGFNGSGLNDNKAAMLNFKDKNYNFYFFSNKLDGISGSGFTNLGKLPVNTQNYINYECICLGNCYLTNYSLSLGIGKPAIVSTKFKSSNISAENFKNDPTPFVQVPALNPIDGIPYYGGNFWYTFMTVTGGNITGDIENRNDLNPPVVASYKTLLSISNTKSSSSSLSPLRNFSSLILQSCDLNLNFSRVDLYKFGNNSTCDRKLQLPIYGELKIESLVSGFNSTVQNSMVLGGSAIIRNQEETYNLSLSFSNIKDSITGFYNFKGAKLNSLAYQAQLNDIYKMSASFSVEITEQTGFYMYRRQK
jgi:hypothetical protein